MDIPDQIIDQILDRLGHLRATRYPRLAEYVQPEEVDPEQLNNFIADAITLLEMTYIYINTTRVSRDEFVSLTPSEDSRGDSNITS